MENLTPKKLLIKLELEANDPVSRARAEGARLMFNKYNEKAQHYRDTHKEHNRIYQREYHRRMRAKKKGKIATFEKKVINAEDIDISDWL